MVLRTRAARVVVWVCTTHASHACVRNECTWLFERRRRWGRVDNMDTNSVMREYSSSGRGVGSRRARMTELCWNVNYHHNVCTFDSCLGSGRRCTLCWYLRDCAYAPGIRARGYSTWKMFSFQETDGIDLGIFLHSIKYVHRK